MGDELSRALPRAERALVPDAGHLPNLDNPGRLQPAGPSHSSSGTPPRPGRADTPMRKHPGPLLQQLRTHRGDGVRPGRGGRERARHGGGGEARAGAGAARMSRRHPASSWISARRSPTVDELDELRRDHLRHADAVREHGRADAQLPRPDRGALDAGRAGRQDRQRLLQHGQPARRAGDDHHLVPHDAAASRHDHRRPAVHLPGAVHHGRDHRAARRTARAASRASATRSRMPTPLELRLCRYQGEHVAKITARLEPQV